MVAVLTLSVLSALTRALERCKGSFMAITIKPSKRGTFTAMAKKAGKSVQGEARAVLKSKTASPAAKKKATFARNAAKWNKK